MASGSEKKPAIGKPAGQPDKKEYAKPSDLKMDLKNPRAGDQEFADEDEAVLYLINNADLDEIVTSIIASGWIDFEPLIVDQNNNIVYEGNRRLAALRLLSDSALRKRVEYKLADDVKVNLPATIRVRWVKDRADARAYIAFKHINGPAKWDALAKARYAADWLDDGGDIDQVSRAIGDTHNTVSRYCPN